MSTLQHREHRQQRTLHRWAGTIRFFGHHPVQARTQVGRGEMRKARVWVRVIRREIAETKAALRPRRQLASSWLVGAFMCIHSHEGAWDANTGNGYHGGLQMDASFEAAYGAEYVSRWGGAENWPVWAQVNAAIRAYQSGRGFSPWPQTARMCGL